MKDFYFIAGSKAITSRQKSLNRYLNEFPNLKFINSYKSNKSSENIFSLIKKLFKYRIKQMNSTKKIFFIGNNSPFQVLIIRVIFPFSHIISDLGYSVFDIPFINFQRRFIYLISDLFTLFLSDFIFLESEAQKIRFKKAKLTKIFKNKLQVLYVVDPDYINCLQYIGKLNYAKLNFSENLDNEERYLLFRGNLNFESGIDKITKCFLKNIKFYKSKNLNFKIVGKGKYLSELKIINAENHLSFDIQDSFMSYDKLAKVIKSSSLMIGQFNQEVTRCKYTLPHKFFEAMLSEVPYITPNYPAFEYFIDNNLIDKVDLEKYSEEIGLKDIKIILRNFTEYFINNNYFKYSIVIFFPKKNFLSSLDIINKKNISNLII